jgi:hypothetical protein
MDYFVLMTKHGVINVKRGFIVNGVGGAFISHLHWALCNMGLGVIEIISYVLYLHVWTPSPSFKSCGCIIEPREAS